MVGKTMSRPKILLVDDSMAILTFMATALRKGGYEVDIAVDGNEALHKIALQKPHCLVLDVILPGKNGYTICRQVRAWDPQHTIPILLISTKDTPFDRSYGLSLGADQYLAKPFTQELLVQTIWNLLPAHMRPMQAPPPLQKPDERLANLIPRRYEDPELLTTTNPFSKGPRMDHATHQLYLAIDGQKTVKKLCEGTGFTMQKVVVMLNGLIEKKYVELYDAEEHKFVESLSNYL
jgi:DNA-binding response OmpR family regulator